MAVEYSRLRINSWMQLLFLMVLHHLDCIDTCLLMMNCCTMYVSMTMCTIFHVVHMHWIMDNIPRLLMGLEILVPNLIHRYLLFVLFLLDFDCVVCEDERKNK